ncbi:MAG: ABC transporter permease [Xenococcus sp. (in: cyanobacteria)]
MAKKFQLFQHRALNFQNPLEFNPQLFREIKRKINGKNIFIVSLISMLMQLFVVILHLGALPENITQQTKQFSRYCTGLMRPEYNFQGLYSCEIKSGIWQINWELFWHDIFIFFSVVSIFILLIVGTYLIIVDLGQEKETGTLNLIRLSPQSASNILWGKILGVPILIYFFVASILPLDFISGLKAKIPWYLILLFALVVITSCAFFYSAAVLFSLLKIEQGKLKSCIVTSIIGLLLFVTTVRFFTQPYNNNLLTEWLLLFNPITVLTYLLDSTPVTGNLVNYMNVDSLRELSFYGQPLWVKASTGIGFILFNYCLWAYWLWQGATRLFHNYNNTIFNKRQSYCISGCFSVIALGFALQTGNNVTIFDNLILLQSVLLVMFLGLIVALSPHRQTLYDWARYRHQLSKDGKQLGKELVLGEKSPAVIAIAINALITTIIILIGATFFLVPEQLLPEQIATLIWGVVLSIGMILFYAVIAQWMLLIKSKQRVMWTSITISLLIIIPPILFATTEITAQTTPLVWLFSWIPAIAIKHISNSALLLGVLGQWLAISLVSWQLIKKIRQAGSSETQKLLENNIT